MAALAHGENFLKNLLPLLVLAVASSAFAPSRRVLLAPYSGIITPVAAEFMTSAMERAEAGGYEAVVLQLDTPGGLDLSMREIVKKILGARVPVIVYVYPSGARAASAGVFITMAAHVAAMAPGTNIGAAHPVSLPEMGGAQPKTDMVMEGKIVSDATAYIKSIAQKRGRNESWAEQAVAKSTSIPAVEAHKAGVIDLVEPDLAALLKAVDGRKLADFSAPLHTAGAAVDLFEMTRRQRWLAALCDPNVAMMLMSLGAAGLFIELYNPGLILPGIVGAVSLLLAFYSFQTLSASYAGMLLILAGMVFFLLEIKVSSYGMLALGGTTATLLGALMLFQQQPLGGLSISWSALLSGLGGILAVVAALSYVVYRAYRRPVPTGREGMVGEEGRVIEKLDPVGKVRVRGEIWDAESGSGTMPEGESVIVQEVRGLRLKVRAKQP